MPRPKPDYRNFLAAVRRTNTGPIPLIELAIDARVLAALIGEPPPNAENGPAGERAAAKWTVAAMHRLGYDVVKISASIPFTVSRLRANDPPEHARLHRAWQDQHRGAIRSMEDVSRFDWPEVGDVGFGPLEAASACLPEGMALLGFAGGVLEYATDLMGLEPFMYAVYDAPDLVAAVLDRVGHIICEVFKVYCQTESVCAVWLGDDLGSKNGLLVSPEFLRRHIFPWYKCFGDLAHEHGRLFLLHSCGNMYAIMPDLVDAVGIDGKHSFEDAIMPVERFMDTWGTAVGTLGGIDVDLLARGPEQAIAARTRQVLEHAAPRGGYACGSGNSIPDYVPPDHYLAMIETVARFNGLL